MCVCVCVCENNTCSLDPKQFVFVVLLCRATAHSFEGCQLHGVTRAGCSDIRLNYIPNVSFYYFVG